MRRTAKKWIGKTLAGHTLESTTRKGLIAMATRRETVIVDSWPANDPPPASGDAREWDAYRNRHGYAGAR